jgi:DNA (cytosine-5)-methyltransferase 1
MYLGIRSAGGVKQQSSEIRFYGKVGCLRTPAGGSSRQFWLVVDGGTLKIRPINPREAMRLMGVPDSYLLPKGTLAGLKIAGDGVAVPVVDWLSEKLLAPLLACARP